MIIVDTALNKREAEGRLIRVAMMGAGYMGRALAMQMIQSAKGMRLVAIANRHIDTAIRAYTEAGVIDIHTVTKITELEINIEQGRFSVTEDPMILCRARNVDVLLEVTGSVEYAAQATLEAIKYHKHCVSMNAELDGTVGPVLKTYADKAGVIYTNVDGDQPGVEMNLYRFVTGIGLNPVLCGNIKGLQDPYRNPTTQEEYARKWQQRAHMVTSFADGTKISFEQAIVANATGMKVARRGMLGPTVPGGTPLKEVVSLYPPEYLKAPGIVDYVVGADPAPGVFVLGTHDNPRQKKFLDLYKMGDGPFYLFYTPYHLCHFEVPNTVGRAVCFGDAALTPAGAPQVDVVATAKKDLKLGEVIDGIGYYMTYGQCEDAKVVYQNRLLPMGLASGCRLKCDLPKDTVLSYNHVELPSGRFIDKLREEQNKKFKKDLSSL